MELNDAIRSAVELARSEETGRFEALVAVLRRELDVEQTEILIELLDSDEQLLRRAAIVLSQDRDSQKLCDRLTKLADDDEAMVLEEFATLVQKNERLGKDADLLRKLLDNDNYDVRLAAVSAAGKVHGLSAELEDLLLDDDSWQIRQKAAIALKQHLPRTVCNPLIEALAADDDEDVQRQCAGSLEHHLKTLGGYPSDLARPKTGTLRKALENLGRGRRTPTLHAWLKECCHSEFDLELLRSFGIVLTEADVVKTLPRAFLADAVVDQIMNVLNGPAPKAAVLVGEPGVGKTAIVHELAHRLCEQDSSWCILQVTPSEFLTGTKYIGEWQTRLSSLIDAISEPRRVVLYIPNVHELGSVGRSSSTDDNVASALAPHLERGEVVLLGESSEQQLQEGMSDCPTLRRLLLPMRVHGTSERQTREIVGRVLAETQLDAPDEFIDRLQELADFGWADTAQPGRVIGLLRLVLHERDQTGSLPSDAEIINAIGTTTGVAQQLLDDDVALELNESRAFFEERVMGQPEAVDAAVDLVTLIKARLTDPGKPFGVMLFVGPTGVGKTELAKSLAGFCFGDVNRLARLDMSEFATYESFERLLGTSGRPGLLTSIVREQPFSVILLDEIEKAHINVYDLCLQIFDAGRLTDGQGRTVDFRRSVIIMTSNVGSQISETAVGFGRDPGDSNLNTHIHRELSHTFRPEFLNRIDRIVLFQPLSEETAERIARREVSQVLQRSGIRSRRLAVDIDSGVFPLLLREGYSRAFGARPLKRVIERMVLLPVARLLASGRVPPDSVIHLGLRNRRVHIDVTTPDDSADESNVEPRPSQPIATLYELAARLDALSDEALELSAQKSNLLVRTTNPGFWDNREEAVVLSDRIYQLESILGQLETLRETVRRLQQPVNRPGSAPRPQPPNPDTLISLQVRTHMVESLVRCREPRQLSDVFVTLTQLNARGKPLGAVQTLAEMFRKLAIRYRFQVDVLGDQQFDSPPDNSIVLRVNGVGSFALLSRETGIHQVSRRRHQGDASRRTTDRELIRVEVEPVEFDQVDGKVSSLLADDIRAEYETLTDVTGRVIARPTIDVRLLHVPTLVSIQLRTTGDRLEAYERLLPLLAVRVRSAADSRGTPAVENQIIRRYQIGPFGIVKDRRTGLTSGHVNRILQGRLDRFLLAPPVKDE